MSKTAPNNQSNSPAAGAAEDGIREAGVAGMSASEPAPVVVFYASQSGRPTLDQGEGGGNPFASALIELLARPELSYASLRADLTTLTEQKSHGVQLPDIRFQGQPAAWTIIPVPPSSKRVAIVFVYADYYAAPALPGAERDMARVAGALRSAGFTVQTLLDPTSDALEAALDALERDSADAEAAALYATGHGFETDGEVYLMPSDGSPRVYIERLARHLKAKTANLIFYGGCRTRR